MDAVGADKDVATRCRAAGAVTAEEIRRDAAVVLRKSAEPMAGVDTVLSDPATERFVDHALQPAAMDRELRILEARVSAARLAPDLLAAAVHVEQFVCANANGVETRQQPKVGEFLDGVGQGVDADAKFANGVRLLKNLTIDAARMKHQRGRQASNPAADDDRFHNRQTQTCHCANGLSLRTRAASLQRSGRQQNPA